MEHLRPLMPSLGMTFAILAIWIVQGFGFVHLFAPTAQTRPLLHVVLAAWAGLIANLLVSVTVYFAIPGATIGQLAWPIMGVLAIASLALTATRGRPRFALDLSTVLVALAVLVAIVLVLRPLVDQPHLGFFESFNGEFTNYAAMGDATQFHGAAFETGDFAMRSREGIAGIACATLATLTHEPALWIIEPFSAALAGIAFASLGVLFQQVLARRQAGKAASAIALLVYTSLIWSSATTFFWTASFVSQFTSIAIWLPTLLILSERPDDDRTTTIVLGIAFGALIVVYWEMLVPNVAMLAAFQLSRARRGARFKAVTSFGLALVIALIVANRFSFEFLRKSTTVSTAGWNMFGGHRTVLRFAANLLGFTSAYHEPAPYSPIMLVLVLVGFAGAALYSAIRAWREPDAVLRGLLHLCWLFFFGLALTFALVIKRGNGNNYIATKLLLGYGSLAYVVLALAAIDLTGLLGRWRPRFAALPLVLAVVLFAGASRGAYRFARIQHRVPVYLQSDGAALRAQLRGRRPFVAAEQYSTEIVGRFSIHARDLFTAERAWPGSTATFVPGSPILVVGDARLSAVKGVTGNYLPTWWIGRLVLFEPR